MPNTDTHYLLGCTCVLRQIQPFDLLDSACDCRMCAVCKIFKSEYKLCVASACGFRFGHFSLFLSFLLVTNSVRSIDFYCPCSVLIFSCAPKWVHNQRVNCVENSQRSNLLSLADRLLGEKKT